MKHFLITTALEKTWPVNQETSVLFLGEWCRLFSRKKRWSKMKAEVLPYHWNNRKKLYHDYLFLQKLYEKILFNLGNELNKIHGTENSNRYWRILVGPWLGYFIQMLFDRWLSIEQALDSFELDKTIIINYEPEYLVSQGMYDFSNYYVLDEWNHFIYSQILLTKKNEIEIKYKKHNTFKLPQKQISINDKILNFSRDLIEKPYSKISVNDDYFFISTYLPYTKQWELEIKLKQIPSLWKSIQGPLNSFDINKRSWKINYNSSSEFEILTGKLVPLMIPTLYLEGYKSLIKMVKNIRWPKKPKVIFTSNACNSEDVFKAWAASKIESGSKLITAQHGGHYGIGKWYFNEEHEVTISDKFFSWGWSDRKRSKIIPLGQLKQKKPTLVNHNKKKGILLVCLTMPRYSYHMYSAIMSSQYLNYLDDQLSFVGAFPKNLQREIIVRLYKSDYGWEQKERWKKNYPYIKLDSGKKKINHLITKTRIFVSTYNATTFLESFSMNIPTVIFWNPKHWELRSSAQPYFDILKKVGIFHETPVSAANHIISIWDDVYRWWNDSETQNAVNIFKENFANNNQLINKLSKEIKSLAS